MLAAIAPLHTHARRRVHGGGRADAAANNSLRLSRVCPPGQIQAGAALDLGKIRLSVVDALLAVERRPDFCSSMLLTMLLIRAIAVVAVVGALTASWRWLRAYRRFRRMELAMEGPPSLPLLGNALSFLGIDHRNILSVLLELWDGRDQDISRASIFNRMLVFATHPDDIARVIQDKESRFNDKPWFLYSAIITNFLGSGSATANGDVWKAHRAMTQPSFTVDILDGYVEYFHEETQVRTP